MNKLITTIICLCIAMTMQARSMYVVSVGICNYKYIRGLRQTENDAQTVGKLFQTHTTHVTTLLGQNATHDRILSTMRSVFSQAGENDVVVLFFSGHGSKGGLCAYDTGKDNLVTYKEIQSVMRSCKANDKQMYIDACFSGGLRSSSQKAQGAQTIFSDTNVMLFLSSRTGEISQENPYGTNGIYTQFLLKGMKGAADANGDRIITARELFNYVSSKVSKATHGKQHPVMWGLFSDNMSVMNWNPKK